MYSSLIFRDFLGTFFWDYSVDSYSGIRITEHTEYQFPKEQTLCYSENRIADVTKVRLRDRGNQNLNPNMEVRFSTADARGPSLISLYVKEVYI